MVYVLNRYGKPLMPCSNVKARILLKKKKAKVVRRTPFTIQLIYGSSGYKQPVTLGVDSGYSHIGLSAVSGKKELFSSEIELRDDISKLLSERRQYRKFRRYRKTRYRKARFLNRRRAEGWLAPSIQHKLDSHIKAVNFAKKILPVTEIRVEVAKFDIQKIKNPDITGEEYQNGEQKGFWNVREYVLYRDNHTCQICKGKSKDKVLAVHHIISRQVGGNRPDNLITLCRTCHHKLHKGEIKEIEKNLKVKNNGFKAESFMSMIRWKIVNKLRELGNKVTVTYGYLTKQERIKNNLPKSHITDAFIIAGGNNQSRSKIYYFIKQVRKNNRKLYRGIRSHIRNTAERFIKGFQRFDKVRYRGRECFIFGRRKTGYFALRTLSGETVSNSASYKELKLLETFKTFLIEMRFLSAMNDGVSNA